MEEDLIEIILCDAQKKHNIKIDINDLNIRKLVSYALLVGYNKGWKERKEFIEELEKK